jgi:hypothetical protein
LLHAEPFGRVVAVGVVEGHTIPDVTGDPELREAIAATSAVTVQNAEYGMPMTEDSNLRGLT